MTRVKRETTDFRGFVATRSQKTRCWLCNAPERKEAEAAWSSGHRAVVIAEWLTQFYPEIGYTALHDKVRSHFTSGRHHEK